MENKLQFKDSNGVTLSGVLSNPSKVKLPIVILCHGLNSDKESSTNTALNKVLTQSRIATLRFDFFAHGESDGKVDDRTVAKFVDDILSAISYLKSDGYKDIGIVGTSFGGLAAVIAASKTKDLKFMALKSPGMGKTSRTMTNYKTDFETKSWFEAAKTIGIPTLIVHGKADVDVEIELGEELAKHIKNSKIEIIEGADHRYTKKEDFDKAIELISQFIIKNVQNSYSIYNHKD